MTYLQFKEHLDKDSAAKLYLIHGEEGYLIARALNLLKAKVVGQQEAEFSLISLDGGETNAQEIINAAGNMSLFGKEKLVVVKNTDALKAKDQERLIEYFPRLSDSIVLAFILEGKPDQRKKFFTAFKQHGEEVSCQHPSPNECASWLRQQAKAHECELATDAANLLLESCGKDLLLLENELNKLVTYVGEKKKIALSDVEKIMGRQPSYTVFNLTDALGQKSLKSALRILNQLIGEGQAPLAILAMLTRQLRIIGQVKELQAQGTPAGQIAKQVGIPPFLQANLIEQAKKFNLSQIKSALARLLEIDIKLKTSPQSPQILMEALLVEICTQ